MNFSGSFNQSSNSAGIGGIIRDPFGIMFFAYAGKVSAAHPLEAELLLAFKKGLEVCKEMQITTLQIEGDSLVLVSPIQQATTMSWDVMPI